MLNQKPNSPKPRRAPSIDMVAIVPEARPRWASRTLLVKKPGEDPPLGQGGKGRLVCDYRVPNLAVKRKGAVMTPLTWLPSFESLSWLSLLAILAVIYTAATIVAEGIVVGVHPDKPIDNPTLVTAFLGLSDMVFIWGGLAMVPEVQSSMRNPKRLVGAFGVDLVYTLAVLLPTAVVGLWAYQNDVSSNILQQLPNGIATKLAAALLSVHMVIAFAVLLNTVMEAAERSCGLRRQHRHLPQRAPAQPFARQRRRHEQRGRCDAWYRERDQYGQHRLHQYCRRAGVRARRITRPQ